jgi:IMP dehydrogenase
MRLRALVDAGVDLVCIDVANGYNSNVVDFIVNIRSLYPYLVLMAGNVCTGDGFEALSNTDVDCVRVGIGNGSICTTRLETGIGMGQFTAIMDCMNRSIKLRNDYQGSVPSIHQHLAHIISDGGSLGKVGNKFKALAAGASAVILGRSIACAKESPGMVLYKNGRQYKYFRGMASAMASISKRERIGGASRISEGSSASGDRNLNIRGVEGVDGLIEVRGDVADIVAHISDGLKSGMSYVGCRNMSDLHDKRLNNQIKFNIVTTQGQTETNTRI